MAETKPTATGNANAVPEQKIKWVSIEDASKLERFVGKYYIKKDGKDNGDVFRVVSVVAATPAETIAPTNKSQFSFLIQKHNKKKTESVSVVSPSGGTETVERPQTIEGHYINEKGTPICVDPYASFFIDSEEFKKDYEIDNE